MTDIDIYMVLAEALGITRQEAKKLVLRQMYGGGSNIVIAEWEVQDLPTRFQHRIVLKDTNGTVVKTSHWTPYRGIAWIDYGGICYRAATEYHSNELPVNCVFTVSAKPADHPHPIVVSEEQSVGRAFGPHGTPNHRCSPFCPQYGRIDTQAYREGVKNFHVQQEAAFRMTPALGEDGTHDVITPNDRPPVKYPPECEHGTKWCTGKGEKHSCDPRTAR